MSAPTPESTSKPDHEPARRVRTLLLPPPMPAYSTAALLRQIALAFSPDDQPQPSTAIQIGSLLRRTIGALKRNPHTRSRIRAAQARRREAGRRPRRSHRLNPTTSACATSPRRSKPTQTSCSRHPAPRDCVIGPACSSAARTPTSPGLPSPALHDIATAQPASWQSQRQLPLPRPTQTSPTDTSGYSSTPKNFGAQLASPTPTSHAD